MKVMNEKNQNFTNYVSQISNSNLTDSDGATCNLDDGELACGDDFADNGETIQGGPCQDLMEYFSDKPYLD